MLATEDQLRALFKPLADLICTMPYSPSMMIESIISIPPAQRAYGNALSHHLADVLREVEEAGGSATTDFGPALMEAQFRTMFHPELCTMYGGSDIFRGDLKLVERYLASAMAVERERQLDSVGTAPSSITIN